jgi:thioredoxin 1
MKKTIVNLTKENFDSVTSESGVVMVECWAEWCGACKDFNPIYEKISKKYGDHTFAKLDSTKEKDLIVELNIDHIPALMLFRDGILLFKKSGYYKEEELEDILSQAARLNMDEVKAHIAAEKIKQTA